jgi:3D (Asp-Asp-Asp) domain-containing protein
MESVKRTGKKIVLCLMLTSLVLPMSGFTASETHYVRIHVDGQTIETHTDDITPEGMLEYAGVQLGEKDEFYAKRLSNQTVITIRRALPVTVEYKGAKKEALTTKKTVKEALTDMGYNVNDLEAVPGMDSRIKENLVIKLKDIPPAAKKTEVATDHHAHFEDSAPSIHTPELSWQGDYHSESSGVVDGYPVTMEASAYLPTDGGGNGITASGMVARHGVVAVDPDVIPLGTRLYIPGYGEAIAADTGGAIQGHKIDLCMESYGEAMQFGRRDITVYVLK